MRGHLKCVSAVSRHGLAGETCLLVISSTSPARFDQAVPCDPRPGLCATAQPHPNLSDVCELEVTCGSDALLRSVDLWWPTQLQASPQAYTSLDSERSPPSSFPHDFQSYILSSHYNHKSPKKKNRCNKGCPAYGSNSRRSTVRSHLWRLLLPHSHFASGPLATDGRDHERSSTWDSEPASARLRMPRMASFSKCVSTTSYHQLFLGVFCSGPVRTAKGQPGASAPTGERGKWQKATHGVRRHNPQKMEPGGTRGSSLFGEAPRLVYGVCMYVRARIPR